MSKCKMSAVLISDHKTQSTETLVSQYFAIKQELERRGVDLDELEEKERVRIFNETLHSCCLEEYSKLHLPFKLEFCSEPFTDSCHRIVTILLDGYMFRLGRTWIFNNSYGSTHFHMGCWTHPNIKYGTLLKDLPFTDIETLAITDLAGKYTLDTETVFTMVQDVSKVLFKCIPELSV